MLFRSSSDWAVGTGDFTIEWFQYQTNNGNENYIFNVGASSMIAVSEANGSNGVNVYLGGTKVVNGAGPKATTSTWYHVAIARTGSTLNTYFNGTRVNQTANSTNINDSGSILYIGTLDGVGSTNDNWPGNISNFRSEEHTSELQSH